MSIEQQLADLTTAVNNLAAVIGSKIGAGAAAQGAQPTVEEGKKPGPKPPKAADASSAPPAATPDTPATTAAPSGDEPIDFTSQIQKPIVALAAGGKRDQALAILKALGAARASDIKPADYAKAVDLIAKAG